MQTLHSDFRRLAAVPMPDPAEGRQLKMHAFELHAPTVPAGFEDYLGPVRILCEAAGAREGLAYLTVDEKIVQPGWSQRRPRPHVDGCYLDGRAKWSHGGGWQHVCNNVGDPDLVRPDGSIKRMSIIVAASAAGCRAWRGIFKGDPAPDGDLGHISDQLATAESVVVPPHEGYLLSPDCVHESMILDVPTPRAFLRIALPLGFEFSPGD